MTDHDACMRMGQTIIEMINERDGLQRNGSNYSKVCLIMLSQCPMSSILFQSHHIFCTWLLSTSPHAHPSTGILCLLILTYRTCTYLLSLVWISRIKTILRLGRVKNKHVPHPCFKTKGGSRAFYFLLFTMALLEISGNPWCVHYEWNFTNKRDIYMYMYSHTRNKFL